MNLFSWSMPFVAEKVTEMFLHIANREDDDDKLANAEKENGVEIFEKGQKEINEQVKHKGCILKNKIQFMSKVLKMQRVLREERENVLKIKALNNNKLPQGILLDGKGSLDEFTEFKKIDSKNERRPY